MSLAHLGADKQVIYILGTMCLDNPHFWENVVTNVVVNVVVNENGERIIIIS